MSAADDYSRITRPYGDTPLTVDHPAQDLNQADTADLTVRSGTTPDIGDLRRQYNFGRGFTKLTYRRDPYLHFLNLMRKRATDDWKFKYTTKRSSAVYRQFGYVMGIGAAGEVCTGDLNATTAQTSWNDTAYQNLLDANAPGMSADSFEDFTFSTTQGTLQAVMMGSDYKRVGQLANRIGVSSGDAFIKLASSGTKPNWFLPNQVVRIPTTSSVPIAESAGYNEVEGYVLGRIVSVYGWTVKNGATTYGEGVILNLRLIKVDSTNKYPTALIGASFAKATGTILTVSHGTATASIAQKLEPKRSYVIGSAYHELSGYGQTKRDYPYSTDFGLTQYFKETAMMSYRAMSTVLKFEANPWTEEWQDKMTSLNLQLAYSSYFGEQYEDDEGITYTEGILNYILNNGNAFSLVYDDKNVDNFLEDMSAFNDPRFKPDMGMSTYYFVPTRTWNWLGKISGYNKNNIEVSPNYGIQFDRNGVKLGVQVRVISVDGSDMKVVRDVNLDGTNIKMVAIDMNGVSIRPLIGNGINNDVSVYPGVKNKQNSGESYRVDLIDADLGFEHKLPEMHAIWT